MFLHKAPGGWQIDKSTLLRSSRRGSASGINPKATRPICARLSPSSLFPLWLYFYFRFSRDSYSTLKT